MARRNTMLLATASAEVRQAIHNLFAYESEWNWVIAESGTEALAFVREQGSSLAMFLMDTALLDTDAIVAMRLVQTGESVDCAPVILMLPAGQRPSQYVPEDLFISEILELPIDRRTAGRRLHVILDLHEYQMRDTIFQHAVSRDPLLGLLSSDALADAIGQELANGAGEPGMLAIVNMDRMRAINERNGHHFGDLVLVDAARTIAGQLPDDAIIGRPHGDTFCAYIPGRQNEAESLRMMENLKTSLNRCYLDAPGGAQNVSACIGVAFAPEHGEDYPTLYQAAEAACGAAKRLGNDVLILFTREMHSEIAIKQAHLKGLSGEDAREVPLTDVFVPILEGAGDAIVGYDFLPMPKERATDGYRETFEVMRRRRTHAQMHMLRVDTKRFFRTLHGLAQQGVALPKISYYIVMQDEQAEMLPQILQEGISDYPIDPALICINIPQDVLLALSRNRLESLSHEIKRLGFAFGVFDVGAASIANACYLGHLLDRILFARSFLEEVLSGTYPQEFMQQVIGYIQKNETVLCFPAHMEETARLSIEQMIGDRFGSYGLPLDTEQDFLVHLTTHTQKQLPRNRSRAAHAFRIGDEGYREIFTRSGIILFDWQPHSDTVAFSESFTSVYGPVEPDQHLIVMLSRIIHPEDYPKLEDLLLQVKHGRPHAEGIYRVRRGRRRQEEYRWRRFFMLSVLQEDGIVSHVYCISFDVDRERREMQDFMKKAESDPLTQLYNRGATESKIREFLDGEGRGGKHALMIIDVDDFKSLNDRLGHIAGDRALQFLAAQMTALFRSDDIIGRIGGDEFMVFLKNIESMEKIGQRADDLCAVARSGPAIWQMSCTVGIARAPEQGGSFAGLYEKADIALYHAKAAGKNHWLVYEPEFEGK